MKHIFLVVFLFMLVLTVRAEGPVYNFNFFNSNSDALTTSDAVDLSEKQPVLSKVVTKKEKSIFDRFEFRYSYGGYNGSDSDMSIYGSQFSLLIPLMKRWHLVLSYLYGKKRSFHTGNLYYDKLASNIFIAGVEKEIELVTNISFCMNLTGFYGKTKGSEGYEKNIVMDYHGNYVWEYIDKEDASYETYGAALEIGPKFRIGKTTVGVAVNSSVIRSDLGNSKTNIGGSLFVGYTI